MVIKMKNDLYIRGCDGKFYKYNVRFNHNYFCNNNIVIDLYGNIIHISSERYILFDRYVVDLKENKIFGLDLKTDDSFLKSINDVGKIEKIEIVKKGKNKIIKVYYKNNIFIKIGIDENNSLIAYQNNYVLEIASNFMGIEEMGASTNLKYVSLPNVKKVGHNFLGANKVLKKLDLRNVEIIGNAFLWQNTSIKHLNLPNLRQVGNYFLISLKNKNMKVKKYQKFKKASIFK